ncbi:MAG: hypothetical protein RR359_05895 [Bacilli bacterium]
MKKIEYLNKKGEIIASLIFEIGVNNCYDFYEEVKDMNFNEIEDRLEIEENTLNEIIITNNKIVTIIK